VLVDVRDGVRLAAAMESTGPDVVVHMAASHDLSGGRDAMYETNVAGTNGVLAAASSTGARHVVVISSAACYEPGAPGALVHESAPLSSKLDSNLARDRATVDRLCQLWGARHPDRTMTILRPCAVLGGAADDATVRLFTEPPFPAAAADPGVGVQFLHEDDFVAAIVLLASGDHAGAYNVASDDVIELRECTELIGLKSARGAARAYSKLRRRRGSKDLFEDLELLVATPRLDTGRARAAGWTPRHTSRSAFEAVMRARGRLRVSPATAPAPLAPDVVPERS
jgi:nucleoside-diphosphate-sugar epimerase